MENTDILSYIVLALILAAVAFAAISTFRQHRKSGKNGGSGGGGGGCAGCAARGSCPFSGRQTPPDGDRDSYAEKDKKQKK